MPNERCSYKDENGEQCGGYATDGSAFCFVHDPDPAKQEAHRQAASKGGQSHGKELNVREPLELRSIEGIYKVADYALQGFLSGELTSHQATTLAKLALAQAKLLGIGR